MQIQAEILDTVDNAVVAVKTEVDNLSRATRDVAALVSTEVTKRPLTYTLAAAGAGALVGLGIMAVLTHRRN